MQTEEITAIVTQWSDHTTKARSKRWYDANAAAHAYSANAILAQARKHNQQLLDAILDANKELSPY